MITLVAAEVRRQTGRRGTFWGSMAVCLLITLLLAIWMLTSSSTPSHWDVINNGTGLLAAFAVICAVVIGAVAGSYDTDQGTMRYLVLTGRPRREIVLTRFASLPITLTLVLLPAILVVLVLGLLGGPDPLPIAAEQGLRTGGAQVFDLFWTVLMSGWLYGTLALAIGTFLRSNAVAIAVAIVLNFSGILAAALIHQYVSHTLGNAFFPVVAGAVVDREEVSAGDGMAGAISLSGSVLILVLWLVVLVGAAWLRVERSEY